MEDVLSELTKKTESDEIRWTGNYQFVRADVGDCHFAIPRKRDKPKLFVTTAEGHHSYGPDKRISRLIVQVEKKLGLRPPLTEDEMLKVAFDCLQQDAV